LLPLDQQLSRGLRQLELDVWSEPGGGLAVHHTPADTRSTCPHLEECLAAISAWLHANPKAVPVFLLIEGKDAGVDADALDAALNAAFPGTRLIRPDDVLPLAERGWPTLAAARGRVVAVLIGGPVAAYSRNGSSLQGRAMFVYAGSGPLAAFSSRPDPTVGGADIAAFVRAGLIVRTQADNDALLIDEQRRRAAIDRGAQVVSARDEGLAFPDGTKVRCDPLRPSACHPADVAPMTTTTQSK